MIKQANTIQKGIKISIPATLLEIKVGETVIIPSKTIRPVSVRAAASRLERANKAKFTVIEQDLIDGT